MLGDSALPCRPLLATHCDSYQNKGESFRATKARIIPCLATEMQMKMSPNRAAVCALSRPPSHRQVDPKVVDLVTFAEGLQDQAVAPEVSVKAA